MSEARLNKSSAKIADQALFKPLTGPYGGTVRRFSVDSGGWLFIATDGGVYRSTNNGVEWEMNLFPSQLYNFVEPVTVLGPNVVVAETDFSNFISTNRGETWNFLSNDLQGFAVDSAGIIYAGSDYSGVKRSVDTGKTWQQYSLDGIKIWKVVLCGNKGMACASDSGLYFSSNMGTSWEYHRYDTPFTWNLVSDRKGHLFALRYYGQNFQLIRSNDFGVSWQHIVLPVSGDAYRIYIEKDGRVIVPVDQNIAMSVDAGTTWSVLKQGSHTLSVGRDADGKLLSGTFFGVQRWEQSNNRWSDLNNGIHAGNIGDMQWTSAGTFIVSSNNQWMRSTDEGNSWSKITFSNSVVAYGPLLSHSSGNLFMAASLNNFSECGLLKSTDDGLSWQNVSLLSNYYAIYSLTEGSRGEVIVTTSYGDIYRSTDGGNSWSKVVSSSSQSWIYSIAADTAGNIFAVMDTTILISHNGVDWKTATLKRNNSAYASINIDARQELFLSSSNDGIFHSKDHGVTWDKMNDGLNDYYILSANTDDSGNVVLGTSSGVYRLADSVERWTYYSEGFPRTFTTSIEISPKGFIYGGTQSYGIYKSTSSIGKRIPTKLIPPPTPVLIIDDYRLFQNFPNPFNGETLIQYEIPLISTVEIKIYTVLGQLVETLFSDEVPKGRYTVSWTPKSLASGLYFAMVRATSGRNSFTKTLKIQYLR